MKKKAPNPIFRVQIAVRAVVEIEVNAASLEEAHSMVREAPKEFFKENPLFREEWEEIDGREHLIGVYEMDPGWAFLEK